MLPCPVAGATQLMRQNVVSFLLTNTAWLQIGTGSDIAQSISVTPFGHVSITKSDATPDTDHIGSELDQGQTETIVINSPDNLYARAALPGSTANIAVVVMVEQP